MEEQKVVYDNNNNTQTPLDDELDSVLEQISQVHKLVNSTNQQFNVLQTKLNEADKSKACPFKTATPYSGYNNQSKFNAHSNKLRKVLEENNINYSGKPIYLGYDAPYKLWGRKNDVLYEITE